MPRVLSDMRLILHLLKQAVPVWKDYYLHQKLHPESHFIALIFQVTNRCNSKCVTCFNIDILNGPEPDISLENIDKLTRSMDRVPSVVYGGGEPILRKDLPDITKLFSERCRTRKFQLPVNAILPERTADVVEQMLKNTPARVAVNFSLDATGELHDFIRGYKGNFDRFKETYKLLADLRERYPNLQLKVNSVLCNCNQDEIGKLLDYVTEELDVTYHHIEPLRGAYRKTLVKEAEVESYRTLIRKYFRPGRNGGKSLYNDYVIPMYHKMAVETMATNRYFYPCRAGTAFPVIDATGNVYYCELKGKIGNLYDVDFNFRAIWTRQKVKEIQRKIRSEKCRCTHSCWQLNNIMLSPTSLFRAISDGYTARHRADL